MDGNDTERTEAAEHIGKLINDNNKLFAQSKSPKSKVAIMLSKENAIILNGMGQEKFLIKALRGAYRVFWEMNYKVDFITPELMEQGHGKQYNLIYMPFLAHITEELSNHLSKYVKDGGILIGTARCGMLGQHGWYNHQMPCFSLKDVFGIKVKDVYSNTSPNITYKKRNYKGHWHKEILELESESVEIAARFDDDQPAITINKCGKGKAIYCASHIDVAYLEENSYLIWELLANIMNEEKLMPEIDLDYTNRRTKEIDAHLLENEKGAVLIITNYVNKEHIGFFNDNKKKVRIKINTDKSYGCATDVETGENIAITARNGSLYFEIEVIKNKTKLLKLQY